MIATVATQGIGETVARQQALVSASIAQASLLDIFLTHPEAFKISVRERNAPVQLDLTPFNAVKTPRAHRKAHAYLAIHTLKVATMLGTGILKVIVLTRNVERIAA